MHHYCQPFRERRLRQGSRPLSDPNNFPGGLQQPVTAGSVPVGLVSPFGTEDFWTGGGAAGNCALSYDGASPVTHAPSFGLPHYHQHHVATAAPFGVGFYDYGYPFSQFGMCPRPPSGASESEARSEEHVKRPPNSFLLFSKDLRKQVSEDHPHMNNAEVSSLLGKMWKESTPDVKKKYVEKAGLIRQQHREENPGHYRHVPRSRPRRNDPEAMERMEDKFEQLLVDQGLMQELEDEKRSLPVDGAAAAATENSDLGHHYASLQSPSKAVSPGTANIGSTDSFSTMRDVALGSGGKSPEGSPLSPQSDSSSKLAKLAKATKSRDRRPPNSFMLWAQRARPRVARKLPDTPNWEISMLLGKLWSTLPDKGKMKYLTKAKILREKHRMSHPEQYRRCQRRRPSTSLLPSERLEEEDDGPAPVTASTSVPLTPSLSTSDLPAAVFTASETLAAMPTPPIVCQPIGTPETAAESPPGSNSARRTPSSSGAETFFAGSGGSPASLTDVPSEQWGVGTDTFSIPTDLPPLSPEDVENFFNDLHAAQGQTAASTAASPSLSNQSSLVSSAFQGARAGPGTSPGAASSLGPLQTGAVNLSEFFPSTQPPAPVLTSPMNSIGAATLSVPSMYQSLQTAAISPPAKRSMYQSVQTAAISPPAKRAVPSTMGIATPYHTSPAAMDTFQCMLPAQARLMDVTSPLQLATEALITTALATQAYQTSPIAAAGSAGLRENPFPYLHSGNSAISGPAGQFSTLPSSQTSNRPCTNVLPPHCTSFPF